MEVDLDKKRIKLSMKQPQQKKDPKKEPNKRPKTKPPIKAKKKATPTKGKVDSKKPLIDQLTLGM